MRRYEMRDLAAAPRFANPGLELGNPAVVGVRPTLADLTVLDTADRRLLRAGVVLAHRFMDGEGEWVLSAPDWSPQLPEHRAEPMTAGQVPDHVHYLLAPFVRGADLAPVGTVRRSRRTYVLRTTAREAVGSVFDDHFTVRRDGQVITQYREVGLDTGSMSKAQVGWLHEVLVGAQAVRVPGPIPLPARLAILADGGEAATGADVVDHDDSEETLRDLVATFLGREARHVLKADLNIRAGRTRKVQPLVRALRRFATDVTVVAPVLDGDALDLLVEDAGWAAEEINGVFGDQLHDVVQGERYLGMFERLAELQDPPLVPGLGQGAARQEIGQMVADAVDGLLEAGEAAPDADDDSGWGRATQAAERVLAGAEVAALVAPKPAKRLRTRACRLLDGLAACDSEELSALRAELEGAAPERAFALGREYAVLADSQSEARAEYVEGWPKEARKLRAASEDLFDKLRFSAHETIPEAAGPRHPEELDGEEPGEGEEQDDREEQDDA